MSGKAVPKDFKLPWNTTRSVADFWYLIANKHPDDRGLGHNKETTNGIRESNPSGRNVGSGKGR